MGAREREEDWGVCGWAQDGAGERTAGFITGEEGDYSRRVSFWVSLGMGGAGGILLLGLREAGKEAQLPGRSGDNIILKVMGGELLGFLIIITH